MINKILNDIDNEEYYYVGINGCLYQDLDKEELLAIKQEIERLNNIINELEKWLNYEIYCNFNKEMTKGYQDTLDKLQELKEVNK